MYVIICVTNMKITGYQQVELKKFFFVENVINNINIIKKKKKKLQMLNLLTLKK